MRPGPAPQGSLCLAGLVPLLPGTRRFLTLPPAAWLADQNAWLTLLWSRGSLPCRSSQKNVVKPSTTLIRFEMRLPEALPACHSLITVSRLQLAHSVDQRESFANEAKVVGLIPGP